MIVDCIQRGIMELGWCRAGAQRIFVQVEPCVPLGEKAPLKARRHIENIFILLTPLLSSTSRSMNIIKVFFIINHSN